MNAIFKHGPSPQHRLISVLLVSVLLIFLDHKMHSFDSLRGFLQTAVSPLQYLANMPKQMMNWASENIATHNQLVRENQQYQRQEIFHAEQALTLEKLKQENDRLRQLLASPVRQELKKMVAEIISVDSDPYTHQVVINRGEDDGVYEGQAVIDNNGIVGQVLLVGKNSSRVILITDITHAVPVRNNRNGIRLTASGTGRIDVLTHNYVPHSSDFRVGDLLVTSGLGGKYPEGYPVGIVSIVRQDEGRPFALVRSQPVANIDRLRYVLLLWSAEHASKAAGEANNAVE